jgi:hypothetical protein
MKANNQEKAQYLQEIQELEGKKKEPPSFVKANAPLHS